MVMEVIMEDGEDIPAIVMSDPARIGHMFAAINRANTDLRGDINILVRTAVINNMPVPSYLNVVGFTIMERDK
jgi:hypothetical protein